MNLYRIIATILLMLPSICLAIDLQPNDIVAPLPGKNHAMISYVNSEGALTTEMAQPFQADHLVALILVFNQRLLV
jgi:hypothetical protein